MEHAEQQKPSFRLSPAPGFGRWVTAVAYEVGSHLPDVPSRPAQDEACSGWFRYCIEPVENSLALGPLIQAVLSKDCREVIDMDAVTHAGS